MNQYRENGIVKYENLLIIPVKDRLPGLVAEYGAKKVHGLLVVMLTQFCNCFNVIRPMSAEQIVECANEILSSSHEDFLSIEDLSIFFSGAKNAKYGKIYDRLDQQTIFEMLEIYRQERHDQYLRIKEEKHANLKSMGLTMKIVDELHPQDARLSASANNLAGAIGDLKNKYKEWKDEEQK